VEVQMITARNVNRGRRRLLAFGGAAALTPLLVRESAADAREVMRRFRRAYAAVDVKTIEGLLAPDVVFSDPTFDMRASGISEMRALMERAAQGVAGFILEVELELVADPWVVVRQKQTVQLEAPPGARISVQNVSLFRLAGGLIAEWHDYADALGYQRQLASIRGKKG
jgi:limonene-1,2-epoxide hydrolase